MLNEYADVLTVAEVAKILGVCDKTVYRLVQTHTIGARNIGRKIKVPKVCVIDYLNGARYTVSNP